MKTLLYATDCTQTTRTALKYAYRLSKVLKANLHVVHVYDLQAFATTSVRSRAVLEKNYSLDQYKVLESYCKENLENEFGAKKVYFHVERDESISKAILATAQRINADLVMVGVKNSKTLRGFFSGNIADYLMKNLECPLLILPDEFHYHGLSTLLYATDFETSDIYAIENLVELAEPYGALIKVMHVHREREYDADEKMEAFKKSVTERVAYPEIIFSVEWADDVESGIHNSIEEEMPEILVMMEREHPSFFAKLFRKDMVETMENEIAIPLLVFNKKSVQGKLIEASDDALFLQWI
ncbi:universal stress protein [uncultured Croceitalea sp.]|uniref:universal stress protein n=1 Tax=uncultured Croceitalea sp. TaxID=1798908 RepID=UPI003305F6B7